MFRGRAVRLKWHRLRQHAGDIAFERGNLRAGLSAGAVLEVDLRLLADGLFAILHEPQLESETSGTGPVGAIGSRELAKLRQRAPDGSLGSEAPLLLADLLAPLAVASPGALIQLDLKEPAQRIDEAIMQRFATTIAPVVDRLTLSGTDAALIRRIGAHIPALQLGYDCMQQWRGKIDGASLDRWTTDALAAMPGMTMVYLDRRLVTAAFAAGFDVLAPFHAAGIEVDIWTIDAGKLDTEADLTAALVLGADQITSNSPIALADEIAALDFIKHPFAEEQIEMPVSFRAADNGFVHVCGHRGYSLCFPENTLTGLEAARRSGATTVEIDIVLSRDGEAVLMHDQLLDRTTDGHGMVADFDLAALRELDAGVAFGGGFPGTRIPTLSETMTWATKHNIGVVIEMKEHERPDQLSDRLLEVLRETNSFGHALALSFNHVDLARLKEKEPGIRTEAIVHARHIDIVSVVKACGADSVSIELNMFAAEDAAALHEAGLSNRLSLPRPDKLAQLWTHGRDPRAKMAEWLRAGLVDSVSGDDVAFSRKLVEQNPITVHRGAKAKVPA